MGYSQGRWHSSGRYGCATRSTPRDHQTRGMEGRNLERKQGGITSLVLPTYNPGPILERTWRELAQFLQRARGEWEVLFVCDGCTDGTPAWLARLARGDH